MKMSLPLHTAIPEFEVRDECLCIGGTKVTEISDRFGGKPFYAYDRGAICDRISYLRQGLPSDIGIHYAVKANPMRGVVDLISRQVDGLDVASAGELAIALEANCNPKNISFAGPGKTIDELSIAVSAGITINVESEIELHRISALAKETGRRPSVAIRVNPDYELKGSGMRMSGGPKQFGIDSERVPGILEKITDLPVQFNGFHIFCGSQSLNVDAICESQSRAVDLAIELLTNTALEPRSINIGGGIGIPYFRGDQPATLDRISANLSKILQKMKSGLPHSKLVLELGRYVVGEAGVYVCSVIDKKVSRGETFLVTNGGLHHHLAASGNFGQVIRKNYPVLIANRIGSSQMETASVVGPLCTPLDILADKMLLAEAEIGDLVAVFQSGAYGFSASPHNFLGHPPPAEVLL